MSQQFETRVARLDRERRYHDERFGADCRQRARKYYAIDAAGERYRELLNSIPPEAEVLEYGCGTGSQGFELARRGVTVTGIDLSPVAIRQASQEAARQQVEVSLREMDAEAMSFSRHTFDAVCGSGILHHLELDRALAEVRRVLKPGGWAVFTEPLGANPAINLYRRLTPSMRTTDEHPLVARDFDLMRQYFADVEAEPYNLTALAGVLAHRLPSGERAVAGLHRLDQRLFRRSTTARAWAWVAVITLRKSTMASVR